jgi:hypothetical protein
MSEQSTPAERHEPVEAAEPVETTPPAETTLPAEPAATTAPQPAVVDAPPPAPAPVYASAPAVPPVRRRGWLPYLGVGLVGVLVGILLTCSAGLLIRVAWGHHHGFDDGPGWHAPMRDQRPGPGFGDGGPFRR